MSNVSPDDHFDLDALAELEQDAVSDPQARVMRAHVAGCDTCTERLARIRSTRAVLAALPPEAMPAAVVARLDAALATAAEQPAAPTVVPLGGRRRWWRSPAVAGGAAAAAVALLVAGIIFGRVQSGDHANSSGSTASTSAGAAAAGAQTARTAAIKEWQTGTNYTSKTIPTLVPGLLSAAPTGDKALGAGTAAAGTAPSAATPAPASSALGLAPSSQPGVTAEQMATSREAVAQCGHILAGDTTTVPLAVDFAKYQGAPAVLVVLPTPGHPQDVDVFVLRGTCSASAIFPFFRIARG